MNDSECRAFAAGQADALRRAARTILAAHNKLNPNKPMSLSSDVKAMVRAYNALKAENAQLKQDLSAARESQPSAEDRAAQAELASEVATILADGQPAAAPAEPAAGELVEPQRPGDAAAGPSLMSQVS